MLHRSSGLFALLLSGCMALSFFSGLISSLFGIDLTPPPAAQPQAEPVVLAVLDGDGGLCRYFYNQEGQVVLKKYDNHGDTIAYTYHDTGALATEIHTTEYSRSINTYDTRGNLTGTGTVNAQGEPELEYITTNSYDDQGRLLESVEEHCTGSSREVTSYHYEQDGSYRVDYTESILFSDPENLDIHCRRRAWFTADGVMTRMEKDREDMAKSTTLSETTFDTQGNIVVEHYEYDSRPEGWEYYESRYDYYTHTYDDQGRLQETEHAYLQLLIDGEDITDTHTQVIGRIEYAYDDAGRMIRSTERDPSGQLTEETTWEYDPAGNLIRILTTYGDWDFTQETIWEYDSEGRLLRREGYFSMTDLEYFFQGKGDSTYQTKEVYTYLPLSQVLADN